MSVEPRLLVAHCVNLGAIALKRAVRRRQSIADHRIKKSMELFRREFPRRKKPLAWREIAQTSIGGDKEKYEMEGKEKGASVIKGDNSRIG